ncbi:sugar phosphate isomerase/epimerase family protein [Paenibacillus puerhi]|uniref:sugar phosphate isomerase/epimerase family protein n=1 Tax=Paenibacillus puerhi TaxID=2692622 RepID=UPI0013578A03|nr:sugar phosphate isomerase/epimerase [Paenibacillus puerhi]
MKLGLSTYSLHRLLHTNEMSLTDAIRWVAEHGGEHVEIVPLSFNLLENPELIDDIRRTAEEVGIEISGYCVGANFVKASEQEYEQEIERTLKHVDIAHRLGVTRMRHDVASRPILETTLENFEADLPRLVQACRLIADHAAACGVTTSLENHGFYVQNSERVRRLVIEVNRPNFRTTLDIGNFLCVDEDPVSAVMNNVAYASMVHLKDFYRRPASFNPGEGWFRSSHGAYLRGAIFGQGDIDTPAVISALKSSGYDGYVSLEFEGMEEPRTGARIALENARRLWEEASV